MSSPMSSSDKHALAKLITAAKPADLAVVHAHAVGGVSGKEALDSLKSFIGKNSATVIVLRS